MVIFFCRLAHGLLLLGSWAFFVAWLVGFLQGANAAPPAPPAPGLSRHSPQGDDGCDRFMLVGVYFGGFRSPQAPAPGATGSGIFTAVCVWRWRRCVKVFLQISPLFCGKICKKLRRGLPHWGMTIASYLRNFLPPYPYLSCRWHADRCRGIELHGSFIAHG